MQESKGVLGGGAERFGCFYAQDWDEYVGGIRHTLEGVGCSEESKIRSNSRTVLNPEIVGNFIGHASRGVVGLRVIGTESLYKYFTSLCANALDAAT